MPYCMYRNETFCFEHTDEWGSLVLMALAVMNDGHPEDNRIDPCLTKDSIYIPNDW